MGSRLPIRSVIINVQPYVHLWLPYLSVLDLCYCCHHYTSSLWFRFEAPATLRITIVFYLSEYNNICGISPDLQPCLMFINVVFLCYSDHYLNG